MSKKANSFCNNDSEWNTDTWDKRNLLCYNSKTQFTTKNLYEVHFVEVLLLICRFLMTVDKQVGDWVSDRVPNSTPL